MIISMAEKITEGSVDKSLQEKLRSAKIARQQLINAKRRYERTNLQVDFERIAKKQEASNEADAELGRLKPNGQARQSPVLNGARVEADTRLQERWGMVQDLRKKEQGAMRRFMRDGKKKQLEKLQDIQTQIWVIETAE